MSAGRFLGGIVLGGALGAIIALLVAPRSGEETRRLIGNDFKDRVDRSVDDVKTRAEDLKVRALDRREELMERGRQIAADLETVGQSTLDKVKSSLAKAPKQNEEPTG